MENRGTDLGHLAGRLVAGLSKSWLSRIQNFARLRVTASIRRHWHELYAQWRQLYERPESYVAGSPTGNKIAVVLAALFIGLMACLAYSIARQHT